MLGLLQLRKLAQLSPTTICRSWRWPSACLQELVRLPGLATLLKGTASGEEFYVDLSQLLLVAGIHVMLCCPCNCDEVILLCSAQASCKTNVRKICAIPRGIAAV